MTTPETQSEGQVDKQTVGKRINMLLSPDDYGLSPAQQAVLAENYEAEEWQDPEVEQFYEDVLERVNEHPGEFVASLIEYGHGIGLYPMLPKDTNPLSSDKRVKTVRFVDREHADISDRVPGWKSFPHGFESFQASHDGVMVHKLVTYRDPGINLTHIRRNTNDGTNKPIKSELIIGNEAIVETMARLDRGQAIGAQCAFMLLSEALGVEVPVLGELRPEMGEMEDWWSNRSDYLTSLIRQNRKYIAKVKALSSEIEVDRIELHEQISGEDNLPPQHGFRVEPRSSYPYNETEVTGSLKNSFSGAEKQLVAELKDLETRQLPFARLYLASIRRFLTVTTSEN